MFILALRDASFQGFSFFPDMMNEKPYKIGNCHKCVYCIKQLSVRILYKVHRMTESSE